MTEEELVFALDPIKERLAALEQHTQSELVRESQQTLRAAEETLRRANQLMQRILDAERRIETHKNDITVVHIRIHNTLAKWASYFDMKPNINFRVNREEECGLTQELKQTYQDMGNMDL